MDDSREVPISEETDSINDEFAPTMSPDPAIPPEQDPLAGQSFPTRDESGPYGLDGESTGAVDIEAVGGGIPDSEFIGDPRMRSTDAGRE